MAIASPDKKSNRQEVKMMPKYADRVMRLGTENAFKIGPHIAKVERSGKEVVKLNLGEPDFAIPDWVKDEIKKQVDKDNTHYCDPKGLLSLRQAIAHQMRAMRGMDVSPDQVVVFPGAKPGIGLAQEVYCNPGDEVIYPSPGFPIYESFTRYVGAVPKPLLLREERDFTCCPNELESLITPKTKLIFLNFPSNPTGGVASREQLEAIAEVIVRKADPSVRVYSDEIYEHIVFDGKKHISIATMPGMEERTIVSSGFSKTYAWTGGRVGYAVFPTIEEADVFKNMNINYFSCLPAYNQEAAREALENPQAQERIHQMVGTFQQRRDVIVKLLNEIDGVSCRMPGGAFYLFPNVSGALESLGVFQAFKALTKDVQQASSPATLFQMFALYQHQVAVMDRRSFGSLESDGQHYLRLSCAADLPTLEQGVKRLKNALADREGLQNFMKIAESLL